MNMSALNYAASVVFAAVAIVLLFATGLRLGHQYVMLMSVMSAACAWFACYVGMFGTELTQVVALMLTVVAALMFVAALFGFL